MQKLALGIMLCSSLLTACSNPFSSAAKAECNDEQSRQLVAEVLAKNLNQTGLAQIKTLITDQGMDLDLVRFKALVQQVKFELTDVRTNRAETATTKKFCQASLKVSIPANTINDANSARAIYQEMDLQKLAILSDLELTGSNISYELEYSVQPTDDGQKIYAEVQNADVPLEFVNQVILGALQKPLRLAERREAEQSEQQYALEEQQLAEEQAAIEIQQAAERQANQAAYQSLQQQEAAQYLTSANNKLNAVWNSTNSRVRNQLLAEQRIWLKKRDLECRLNSEDAQPDLREVARLRCETEVTNQRIGILQQLIARAEAEQPATAAPTPAKVQPPSKSASDLATERAAAENAARLAENVQHLEQQLRGY